MAASAELNNPTPGGHCVGPQNEQAGVAESCRGCPNATICASAPKGPDADMPLIAERMASISFKVLVLSGKGGVGKSTMTKELGFALAAAGAATGLVDVDICGPSLPRLTGTRDEEVHSSASGWEPVLVDDNLTLMSMHFLLQDRNEAVVWRGPKKNHMIKDFLKQVSWGELDVLLFDTPPGTTDEHLSTVSLLQQAGGVTGAIIVTTPQEVAVADVRREANFCRKMNVPILGFVENMSGFVCPKCHHSTQIFPSRYGSSPGAAAEKLSQEFGAPVLGTVPLDPRLMQACELGKPLRQVAPDSPAVAALDGVARKLMAILQAQGGDDVAVQE